MKANKMVVCRKAFRHLAAGFVVAVGLSSQAAVEPPSFIAERALLWLDAMDETTLTKDGDGKVSAWTSKGVTVNTATIRYEGFEPIYDTTTYGIPTVDFGAMESKRDLKLTSSVSGIRTFFLVVKIENHKLAKLLGSGDLSGLRGSKGQYGSYPSNSAAFDAVWDLGESVDWKSTVIPDDSFRVICVNTTKGIGCSCLTMDRNFDTTTGGRQVSEMILFNVVLSDAEREQVTSYLMKKWGFAKAGITVRGFPGNYGNPEPDYGLQEGLEKGASYTFSCSSATNDSRTLHRECLGWTLLDSDMVQTSGPELSKVIVYDEKMESASLTWTWDGFRKLAVSRDYKLPSRYREVEYLEQDTGAYVDTGFSLKTTTTEVLLTVGANETVDYSSNQMWAGSNGGGAGGSCFQLGRYQKGWWIAGSENVAQTGGGYPSSRGPLTISISGADWFYMDPSLEEVGNGFAQIIGATDGTGSILLFTVSSGKNVVTSNRAAAGVRIYGLAVYDNHVCTHRLVPCYSKKDSVPGFYDVVTDTFLPQISLPNVTDGKLKAGPKVGPDPGLVILFY